MSDIKNLEPKTVWKHFDALASVPHPSGHLDEIRKHILDWSKTAGVEAAVDNAGNILLKKPATVDYEDRQTVTLQAHLDMVPQKAEDSTHNFETDPLQTYIDGEWVRARGTTLGADNGVGVAAILAIMEDKTLKHGALEGFLTVDEETCMYGVNNLRPDTLSGDILFNLDNETHGEMVIGSAGGMNVTATLQYEEVETDATDVAIKVVLKGLKGGHSGLEINEGRANANKLMARFVHEAVADYEARLSLWNGGNMRNAIPRECEVVLTLPAETLEELQAAVALWGETFRGEYGDVEPDLVFTCTSTELPKKQVPEEIQDNFIHAVLACPNGVYRFIPAIPDIVETSSNLAIINMGNGKVDVMILVRSARDTMLDANAEAVSSAFAMAGMKIETGGRYPAWQPNPASPIVTIMKDIYREFSGEENNVLVIHAGLECGIIGALYPKMDLVSFGPTIRSPHTPNERLHIASVAQFYNFLIKTLEAIPVK